MTLDERIQALTETVELMAAMDKDRDKRIAMVEDAVADIKEAVVDIKDLMNRMGRILEHHDLAIDDHELLARRQGASAKQPCSRNPVNVESPLTGENRIDRLENE